MEYVEHHRAEGAPRESEELYHRIAEMATDAIITIDPQSKILFANSAAEKMFGYEPGELGGQPLTMLMPEDLHSPYRGSVNQYIATGEKHFEWKGVEFIGLHKSGRLIPLELSLSESVQDGTHIFIGILREIAERQHAEDQLQRRANEFAALYETARDFAAPRDLLTSLQTIVERAMTLLSAPAGEIFLYNAERRDLEPVVTKGFPGPLKDVRLQLGEGMAGRVAQTRQPLIVNDYQAWEHRALSYEGIRIRAVLEVPMLYSGQLIGVLAVGELGTTTRKFTEEDVRLLSLFAAQAASAVHNAQLYRETRRRRAEMETINKISTALRTAQTLDEMPPILLDETLAALNTNAGRIFLYDAAHTELRAVCARGWFTQITTKPVAPREGITGHVVATGEPYLTREFASDPLTRESARPDIPPGWGGACVPIRAAHETVGALFVSVQRPRELTPNEVSLLTTLAEIAGDAIHRARLHESLEESFIQTILALAKAIDAHDSYTSGHSERMAEMAVAVAQAMGLSSEEQEALRFAARLHDIGKIGVPDAILRKPSPLTAEEWTLMRQHPVIGAQILMRVQRLQKVALIVRHHQEKFDGSGYPDGLAGEAIPLGARILSVVDAYSAMIDDRVYRKGYSPAQARGELKNSAGEKFDPQVVQAFLKVNGKD